MFQAIGGTPTSRSCTRWNQQLVLCLIFSTAQVEVHAVASPMPGRIILVTLVSSAQAQFRKRRSLVDWRTFEVPDFGTSIQYPANIFAPAGKPEKGLGQRFERSDGRAVLSIYSRPNEAGENPTTYLRRNLRMERSALDYVRITRSFFAISSERDGVILYSRCNFSGGARGVIHCFDLKYPEQEKRSWDAGVTRISLSLRPLEVEGGGVHEEGDAAQDVSAGRGGDSSCPRDYINDKPQRSLTCTAWAASRRPVLFEDVQLFQPSHK
jgi:hypothetical protein